MPRPSSPLNAKASVRSPYALDRSQQNPCVRVSLCLPGRTKDRTCAHTCASILSLQTMMSSRIHPGSPRILLGEEGGPDRPFNSRCQICHVQPGQSLKPGWKLVRSAIAGGMLSPSGRSGGVRRDRTDDLMLAKHALYQLSYDPPSRKAAAIAGSTLLGG